MAVLTLTGRSVSLSSSWTYRYNNQGVVEFSTPTTAYDAITFDLSGIPSGAEIQSAVLTASRWGSGRIRTMYGVDSDRVEISTSRIVPGESITITFAYQANGGYTNYDTSTSGTVSTSAGWNNITLTVAYEMPYTAPTAPTQVIISKAMAMPGESVTLSWSGAKAGNNVSITGYQVYRAVSADGEYILLVETAAEILQVAVYAPESAGSYFYKVKTLGSREGYDSALSSAYTQVSVSVGAPTPPNYLSVSPAAQYPGGEANLTFGGAAAGENNPIRGYALWMADQQDGPFTLIDTIDSEESSGAFEIYAPDSGSRYYKVQTLGQHMDSALSVPAVIMADLSGTSDFTLSSDTVDAGTNLTITLLSNTDKDHDLIASIGEYSETIMTDAGQGTINFTPPMEWLSAMPDSEKWPMLLTLRTAGAGTIRKEASLRCPDNVGPKVTGAYAARISDEVPDSWAVYVQGKSRAEIHLDTAAETAYGSPIVSYRMEGGGAAAESADVPFATVTGLLNAGEIPVTVTATDARGRTGKQTLIIPVEPYQPPRLANILTQRCDEDGQVQDEGAWILAAADTVVSSCGGHNAAETYVSFRPQGGEDWIAGGYLTSGALIFGDGEIDIGRNYEIRYDIHDLLQGSTISYDVITRAKPELHIRRGGGAWAFGGLADVTGALKVYGNLMMTGGLLMGEEHGDKLLYISQNGKAQPLQLGPGLYIAEGMLCLGNAPGTGDSIASLPIGTEIYLMEDTLQPYILIAKDQHGSGNVTLLRKYAAADYSAFHFSTPSGEANNKYDGSSLESNHAAFFSALPAETQAKIAEAQIPVRASASGSTVTSIAAHMFPLSEMEYTGSGAAEGSFIAYFAGNAQRIAYAESGAARVTWTRSVTGGMNNYSRQISASGSIGNQTVVNSGYLRPACCVKSDALVAQDADGRYIL
ncbi:MAG: hypothetical protein E7324_04690 [Clostridiales bacterium]|nr:hypothetical protein [Clostridiales bacterium]